MKEYERAALRLAKAKLVCVYSLKLFIAVLDYFCYPWGN